MSLPRPLSRLIAELARMPSIGQRSAERLAFFLLRAPAELRADLSHSIATLTDSLVSCEICQNVSESSPCAICADSNRSDGTVCVVEEALDLAAFEASGIFRGRYHVLGGAVNPLAGVTPRDLKIDELLARFDSSEKITEIILATNATLEGEATATYIAEKLKPKNVAITRLGRGLPSGGNVEFADEVTLRRALEGRKKF